MDCFWVAQLARNCFQECRVAWIARTRMPWTEEAQLITPGRFGTSGRVKACGLFVCMLLGFGTDIDRPLCLGLSRYDH